MLLLSLSLFATADAASLDLLEVGGEFGGPGAQNPTAIWWNPAGLAVGGGHQFLVQGSPIFATVNFDRANPNYGDPVDLDGDGTIDSYDYGGADTVKFTGVVPFVGASSDFGVDGLGVGFGLFAPTARGGSEVDPPGSGSYFLREGNIQAVYTSLGVAYQIADIVAIGASGNYVDSTWHAVTDVEVLSTVQPLLGGFAEFHDQEFEADGYRSTITFDHLKDRVFSFGTGIYITPLDMLGISVAYQHGLKLNHEGDLNLKTNCAPEYSNLQSALEITGLCDADLNGTGRVPYTLPSRVHGAVVLHPIEKLRLEAMGGWVGWSAFDNYELNIDIPPEAFVDVADTGVQQSSSELASQQRNWARDNVDSFWLGFDGKFKPLPVLTTGAKVVYDKSAIPDRVVSTNNFDGNTVTTTLSGAVGLKQLTIGLAYAHTFFPKRTVTNSAYSLTLDNITEDGVIDPAAEPYFFPSANGTYTATIDRIGLTIAGKFGK